MTEELKKKQFQDIEDSFNIAVISKAWTRENFFQIKE